ncbi:TetR family transcriptional regulator [Streptomonospora nanhaiensis]|uniref:AcrR family transcriptional regulator n=1 Tax=Streptomonospora nanhaiensis TaxID=1323731 RepID=A0A853BQX8_9ACTN|nr:TetR/AcrR family transcriptional regulator [Streptomonospora nanhaiensis]MBV2366699.1 TetR/AcrR family transcriptional regulator [Streptomonospora nanhaiensis]MBX9387632.1 TetR/AcrR family transcriptional regulator [Streptomonospora nanhaiensis]NYI97135.1 AcrR family transcriptional regulator [Streptomonospora nanhaiensis]
MARTADPQRRRAVVDAVIEQLARTGIADFTLRGLAEGLGQSTRVLTHHFADKNALLTAVLERLDERQHTALRATPGWDDPAVPVGSIVEDAWRRNLGPDEVAMTRLIREIEGLAAAGRLPLPVPGFVRGRAEFVGTCLVRRGMSEAAARTTATLLNAAYAGLEGDYLATGDRDRVEAALKDLCAWVDARVAAAR